MPHLFSVDHQPRSHFRKQQQLDTQKFNAEFFKKENESLTRVRRKDPIFLLFLPPSFITQHIVKADFCFLSGKLL